MIGAISKRRGHGRGLDEKMEQISDGKRGGIGNGEGGES